MAPLKKPRGQTRRPNAEGKWKELPANGRTDPAPALPDKPFLDRTREWWKTIWASPMATVWQEADVDGLVRLAELKDLFARGDAPATALPAMQQLEDRFGLNPKARRALQWEIAQAEEAAAARRPTDRRLRAV